MFSSMGTASGVTAVRSTWMHELAWLSAVTLRTPTVHRDALVWLEPSGKKKIGSSQRLLATRTDQAWTVVLTTTVPPMGRRDRNWLSRTAMSPRDCRRVTL